MSLKGVICSKEHLPKALRNRPDTEARAAEMTERWRIVAHDPTVQSADGKGMPIVAEELDERALRKLSSDARVIATMMLRHPPELRREVMGAFDADGKLKHPFTFI